MTDVKRRWKTNGKVMLPMTKSPRPPLEKGERLIPRFFKGNWGILLPDSAFAPKPYLLSVWVWSLFFFLPAIVAAQKEAPELKGMSATKEGLTIENETSFVYVGDNGRTITEAILGEDDNRAVFTDRIGGSFRKGNAKGGVTLQLRMFPLSPRYAPGVMDAFTDPIPDELAAYDYGNDMRVDRIWYQYRKGPLNLRFGDFSLTIGKGIAFHVDGETTGWDRATVNGGSVVIERPGRLKLGIHGGGVNTTNQDPVTHTVLYEEVKDTVIALDLRLHLAEVLGIGIHGVHIEPRFKKVSDVASEKLYVDEGPGIRVSTVGTLLDFRLGGGALYLEGNVQSHDNFRLLNNDAVQDEIGYAVFAEASWDSGPVFRRTALKLTAQGVLYRKFLSEGTWRSAYGVFALAPVMESAVRYHSMPTLEPEWVLIRSLGNQTGGRLLSEMRFKRSDTRLEVSANFIEYLGGVTPSGKWEQFGNVQVFHPVVQLEQPFRRRDGKIRLQVGGRYEKTDMPANGYADSGYLLHGTLAFENRFNQRHALEMSSQIRRHQLGVIEENADYWVSDNSVVYSLLSHWRFKFGVQYSDELEGPYKHSLTLFGARSSLDSNWFFNGAIDFEGSGLFESFVASLSAGTFRGGYRCHMGSCRIFPDTAEAMVSIRYRL